MTNILRRTFLAAQSLLDEPQPTQARKQSDGVNTEAIREAMQNDPTMPPPPGQRKTPPRKNDTAENPTHKIADSSEWHLTHKETTEALEKAARIVRICGIILREKERPGDSDEVQTLIGAKVGHEIDQLCEALNYYPKPPTPKN